MHVLIFFSILVDFFSFGTPVALQAVVHMHTFLSDSWCPDWPLAILPSVSFCYEVLVAFCDLY
jgi:hypothetical protein